MMWRLFALQNKSLAGVAVKSFIASEERVRSQQYCCHRDERIEMSRIKPMKPAIPERGRNAVN